MRFILIIIISNIIIVYEFPIIIIKQDCFKFGDSQVYVAQAMYLSVFSLQVLAEVLRHKDIQFGIIIKFEIQLYTVVPFLAPTIFFRKV